jgi:pyridoxal phosphate enzyme (YggS family)
VSGADVARGLSDVRARIAAAAERAGRDPAEVTLVGASKTVPPRVLRDAFDCGLGDFGENRMQEALPKVEALSDLACRWHFIGQLQSNKVKFLANRFQLVHSVDRPTLAREIDRWAGRIGCVQPVLVQVNVAREASKAGVAPEEVEPLCTLIRGLPAVRLAGLMTIAPEVADPEEVRPVFRALRVLRDRWVPGGDLSMGMSGDFEVGVEEGATLVRVGRAIFGPREVV